LLEIIKIRLSLPIDKDFSKFREIKCKSKKFNKILRDKQHQATMEVFKFNLFDEEFDKIV
jgi:hypothetical protein